MHVLLQLKPPPPQFAHQLDRGGVERDRAAATGRLGWSDDVASVNDHDLFADGQSRVVEVDVGPPQGGDFATV